MVVGLVGADPWLGVRHAVTAFYERVVSILDGYSSNGRLGAPVNIFYYSIGGRRLAVLSRFERILVTVLGDHCLSFIAPFLVERSAAPYPWTALVKLRSGWKGYVRVVPAYNSINSALKREIVRSYRSGLGAPSMVLTIQGEDFEAKVLHDGLLWYGPSETWFMVTGERDAYSKFKGIVLEVGRSYRHMLFRAADRMTERRGRVGSGKFNINKT